MLASKTYKSPKKARLIISTKQWSLKPFSKFLNIIFKAFFQQDKCLY